jgi:hypothetical protein
MTNNKQQTAVEQMFQEMLEIQQSGKTLTFDENLLLLEKYKEMEKKQAIKLHYEYELYVMMNESSVMTFGQFYKQTYGGTKL